MTQSPTRPEDVLSDQDSFATFRGVKVRKGSIAAVLRNLDVLQDGAEADKAAAMETIKELAPGLAALGMHKHFICRNAEVEAILAAAEAALED